jgi:hypothetical protein
MRNQASAELTADGSGFVPMAASGEAVRVCPVCSGEQAQELMFRGVTVDFVPCEACHRVALATMGLRVVRGLDGVKRVVRVNAEEMEVAA